MGSSWSRGDEDDAQAAYLASWRPGRWDSLVLVLGYAWFVFVVVFVWFCLHVGGVL